MLASDTFVSVVLVIEEPTPDLGSALAQLQAELVSHYTDYEILLVAPGPLRNADLVSAVDALLQPLAGVRHIQLAGKVARDSCWAAGVENAIGDCVVLFDPRQDPVSIVSPMVALCEAGQDVVVGVAKQSRTVPYRIFRLAADRMLHAIGYHIPSNATDLRCLSRRAVNAVTSTARFHHQFHMRIQKTGYPFCIFKYEMVPGHSPSRSLRQGVVDFLRLLVFNSTLPLRWMSVLGLSACCLAFLLSAYSVLIHLVRDDVVPGWTTTILFTSILLIPQFVMLAFFGEYLRRLLEDRAERADYAVVFERTSPIMLNQDRVNVTDTSLSLGHQSQPPNSR